MAWCVVEPSRSPLQQCHDGEFLCQLEIGMTPSRYEDRVAGGSPCSNISRSGTTDYVVIPHWSISVQNNSKNYIPDNFSIHFFHASPLRRLVKEMYKLHRVKLTAKRLARTLDRAMIRLSRRNTKSILVLDDPETINIFPSAGEIVHYSRLANPQQVAFPLEKKEAYVLHDVFVWPQQGIVGTMDGDILEETAFSPYALQHMMSRTRFSTRNSMPIDAPCVSIESDPFWSNYYHTLIDKIPRLYSLHHGRFINEKRILLLIPREPSELERLLLEIILPPNVELLWIPAGVTCVTAKEYIFLPYLHGGWEAASLPPEYLAWFRNRVFAALGVQPRGKREEKIYISREKASKRRYANEQELGGRLQDIGFRKYVLEEMSFPEQVELFQRAKMVFARHGAGLTNLLFATDCCVLEHVSATKRKYYRMLSAAMDLPYANLVSENAERDACIHAPIDEILAKITQMTDCAEPFAHTIYRPLTSPPEIT